VLRAVFLTAVPSRKPSKNGQRVGPTVVLETENLTKRYGTVAAVSGLGLALHEGEILGLIGPNGAGKTTVFDLLTGLLPVDDGAVYLAGVDVTDWPAHVRARCGLGRSFQDARLWPSLTVREALAVAMERHVEVPEVLPALVGLPAVGDSEAAVAMRVDELIELLGLGAFRDKFVAELSTGSRRIVEIGAMLAHRPRVLLLDEPSSGIAQKETEALGPLLRDVQHQLACSMLVIEHDMRLITGLADRIVALDLGQVIADGTPAQVTSNARVIDSYLGEMADEVVPAGEKK
jgi:ABC-type branched-subunit amino acid transport system ATPase component